MNRLLELFKSPTGIVVVYIVVLSVFIVMAVSLLVDHLKAGGSRRDEDDEDQ